jgi:hypothetical protein
MPLSSTHPQTMCKRQANRILVSAAVLC